MTGALSVEVAQAGSPLGREHPVAILLHGRGGTAQDMLSLAEAFGQPNVTYLAPQAPGRTWYPYSFLAPYEQNEPALSHALEIVAQVVSRVMREDIPANSILLLGFSQGGCLALEFAARNAKRYGAVVGLSAGLIGPKGAERNYGGSLAGTPVFIGCSDVDHHIPLWRVRESTEEMRRLGADVIERIYPRLGHTINDDEIMQVKKMLTELEGLK